MSGWTTVALMIGHPARSPHRNTPRSMHIAQSRDPALRAGPVHGAAPQARLRFAPMTVAAAVAVCALLAALAAFQVLLILGQPLGRFAWGGAHDVLPPRLRIGSAISIVLYGLFAAVVLDRAKITDLLPDTVVDVGIWVLVGYLALGTLLNGISRSKPERNVMTPTVLLLAVLCLVVALG